MTGQLVMEHSVGIQDHEIWKQVNRESTSNLLQHEHSVKLSPDPESVTVKVSAVGKKQTFSTDLTFSCNKYLLDASTTCWSTDICYKRNI